MVVGTVFAVVAGGSRRLRRVAFFLQFGEQFERNVEHILLGPHRLAALLRVSVVVTGRSKGQRNLVFVVVVLVVASQTHEESQLVVGQVGNVVLHCVGMYEHLYALVLTHIHGGILVDSLRLARAKVVDGHCQSLFVRLYELRLSGVLFAADARRQHVVDGSLVVVLLDIYRADRHLAR